MSKFKVGDRVKVVMGGWGISPTLVGRILTITKVNDKGRAFTDRDDRSCTGADDRSFKLVWRPKPGEMIEVTDHNEWGIAPVMGEFRGMIDGQFIVLVGDTLVGYKKARPIKDTVTIIKESTGEKVEISQESSARIFG